MVDGVARAKGLKIAAEELGILGELEVDMTPGTFECYTDSSAAKAMASRRGSGRIRHIEVRHLWLQEEVARGRVRVRKIKGTENPADVGTKFLGKYDIQEKMRRINVRLEFAAVEERQSAPINLRKVSWADTTEEDESCYS